MCNKSLEEKMEIISTIFDNDTINNFKIKLDDNYDDFMLNADIGVIIDVIKIACNIKPIKLK